MRIKVEFTVEVDEHAWADEYGIVGATEVRRDVQSYAKSVVTEHFATVGVLAQ